MEASIAMKHYVMTIRENVLYPKELAEIVVKILENPLINNFSEILALDEIEQLEFSECKAHFNALKMFSTGTLRQYSENLSELIPLTEKMELKLRLLTVLTMATERKSISYDELQAELNFQDVRHLEDLIIEAIYAELIVAKLDQKNRRIEFDSAMARDVQPEDIPWMIQTFEQWLQATEGTSDCIRDLMIKSKAEKCEYIEQNQIRKSKWESFLKKYKRPDATSPSKDDPKYMEKMAKRRKQDQPSTSTEEEALDRVTSSILSAFGLN